MGTLSTFAVVFLIIVGGVDSLAILEFLSQSLRICKFVWADRWLSGLELQEVMLANFQIWVGWKNVVMILIQVLYFW